jgi:hypothetical protein
MFGLIPLDDRQIADYIAVFRYLAYLLGTPTSYFETVEKAKCAMESFLVHEVRTTETSRTVAYNFLECVTNLPPPFSVSSGFVAAGSRWINGDALCDELELERPGIVYRLSFVGFVIFATVLAWVQKVIPGVDSFMVNVCFLKSLSHGFDCTNDDSSSGQTYTQESFSASRGRGLTLNTSRRWEGRPGKRRTLPKVRVQPSVWYRACGDGFPRCSGWERAYDYWGSGWGIEVYADLACIRVWNLDIMSGKV